jgi:hypothetical protein
MGSASRGWKMVLKVGFSVDSAKALFNDAVSIDEMMSIVLKRGD